MYISKYVPFISCCYISYIIALGIVCVLICLVLMYKYIIATCYTPICPICNEKYYIRLKIYYIHFVVI